MNELLLGVGIVVVLFVLAIAYLAFHPEFGAPPERRRPDIEISALYDDAAPGAFETEVELRFAPYEPPPPRPGGTGREWR